MSWQSFQPGSNFGSIVFLDGGAFQMPNGMRLSTTTRLVNCSLGDSIINCDNGVLSLQAPNALHEFMWDSSQGCWFYRKDGGVAEQPKGFFARLFG